MPSPPPPPDNTGRTMDDPIERYAKNPKSRKLAIYAKCWDCCGAGTDSGTKATIGDCPVVRCALHPFRPFQGFAGKKSPSGGAA